MTPARGGGASQQHTPLQHGSLGFHSGAWGASLSVTELSSLNLRDSLALRPRTQCRKASFVASLGSSLWGAPSP